MTDRVEEDATKPDKPTEQESQEDIVAEAVERFSHATDVDQDNRDAQKDDTRFVWVKGAQWEKDAYDARDSWDQPCLEASQLTQFIKQVVNDQRQSRPGIRISAASGDASEETAKILQGMIRHIEVDSNAESAYDSAFEHAVTGGRGFIRVLSAYEDGASFDQKLLIKRVQDPLSVYPDPDYREPDGSDMGWCFVVEKMSRKKFEKAYPKAEAIDWEGASKDNAEWFDGEDDILVADYYRRVKTPRTLYALSDGRVVWKDEITGPLGMDANGVPITVKREREADDFRVEWYKLAGGEQILETFKWPGKTIPVVVVPGNEIYVDGKRQFQGLIRRARDTQMMYNYLISAAAERVALAPKAPWVMAEGQDENYENLWKDANRTPYSRLIYKPVTIGDQLAPPPQRQSPVAAEMGLLNHAEMCKGDIKSILGMYESSLGQRGNETSGRAILAREKQSDNATFDFVDNLASSITLTGKVLLECIPAYYDTQRVVGIVNPDDTKSRETINQDSAQLNPATGALEAIRLNDVSKGKYAVTVQTGPTYATKKQESSDSMMAFLQVFPQAAPVLGDLVAKAQDWADSDLVGERMQYLLPPEIRQAEEAKKKGQTPPDPAMQQQLQQMQQGLQQAQQFIVGLQQELEAAKKQEQAKIAEVNAKREVDLAAVESDRVLAMAKIDAGSQDAQEKARADAAAKIACAEIDKEASLEIEKIRLAGNQEAAAIAALNAPPEMGEEPGEADEGAEEGPEKEDMMAAALTAVADGLAALAAAQRAPKEAVTPDGRVIKMRTVETE